MREVRALGIGGAVIALIGTVMPWVRSDWVDQGSFPGARIWEGDLLLIVAVAVAVGAALYRPGVRALSLNVSIGGLAIAGLAGLFVLLYRMRLTTFPDYMDFRPQVGPFIAMFGGLLACVAGTGAWVRDGHASTPERAGPPPSPPPVGVAWGGAPGTVTTVLPPPPPLP